MDDNSKASFAEFFARWNLGIKKIPDFTFWNALKFFLPELLVISSVLAHIHSETLAGIFGVSTYEFESFEDGLYRYQTKLLERKDKAQTEDRRMAMELMERAHAMNVGIDFKQINKE